MEKQKYKCLLCGRDNFDAKQPHKCVGGFRKRNLQFELVEPTPEHEQTPVSKESLHTDKVQEQEGEGSPTIADILGLYEPWPLIDVLKKLVEATKYLLNEKNYDRHGWEEVLGCTKRGDEFIELLSRFNPSPSPVSRTGMSLQECKDQIGRNHKYKDWDALCRFTEAGEYYVDEVAELYASQFKQQ